MKNTLYILFSFQQVSAWLIGISGTIITLVLGWYISRKKQRAEIDKMTVEKEGLVVQQYDKLVDRLNAEYEKIKKRLHDQEHELENRIQRNTKIIAELQSQQAYDQRRMAVLEKDNENCKYQHSIVELELKLIKKQHVELLVKKELVCVLDDDPDVIEEFGEKFIKITILQFLGFTDYNKFIHYVETHRPAIIVTDYRLGVYTAEDVLKVLSYEPEVIVMSGILPPKGFIRGRIKFFKKEEHYIYRIAASIVNYLNSKYDEQQ